MFESHPVILHVYTEFVNLHPLNCSPFLLFSFNHWPSLFFSHFFSLKEGKYIANYFSTLIRSWRAGEMTGWQGGEGGFFFKPFNKLTRLWIFSLGGRRWNNLQADLCVKRIYPFNSFLCCLVRETGDVAGQSTESLTKSGAVIKHGCCEKLTSHLSLNFTSYFFFFLFFSFFKLNFFSFWNFNTGFCSF